MALHMYDSEGLAPVAKRARIDYNTNYEQRPWHPLLLPPQLVDLQLSRRTNEGEQPNHVLLFTVLNPTYPITCDVLHTITAPFGKLVRVVIFKKNGVQAMMEFDSLESAQRAKDSLHGCDIYSSCCTLKIEYAKPTKLNVYKNDTESFDFTNPMLGKGCMVAEQPPPPGLQHHRPVLLKEPVLGGQEQVGHTPNPPVTSDNHHSHQSQTTHRVPSQQLSIPSQLTISHHNFLYPVIAPTITPRHRHLVLPEHHKSPYPIRTFQTI